MMHESKTRILLSILALATWSGCGGVRDAAKSPEGTERAATRTEIFAHPLPQANYDKVSVVTVEYPPGGTSPKHRHDVSVFAYVLQGEVESKVDAQESKIYKQGDMFYEAPGAIHLIARNPSATETAKLLVFYVEADGKVPMTVIK
ncbi:MAG TPA: cupin domain-containing protein [Polyangiaceae bacterium]|nr:cupin domain-containing protein [Polyangiaceae bacterium]